MTVDSGNRSFLALVALVVIPYALLAAVSCGLLSVVAYRLATDGFAGLHRGTEDLRPAAVFFALIATGTIVAAVSVRRQVVATHRLAQAIAAASRPLPDTIVEASARVGLAGSVDMWDDARPCSFTYGLVAPRVVVSRGLADNVTVDELEAVLHHERYHVRNRDTLKIVVARAAPSAFFFLPALRPLRDRYLAGRELAADRRAVRAVGERAIAGALCKVIDGPDFDDLGAAAALGGGAFLEQRVEQLERGVEPPFAPLSRTTLVATAGGLLVLAVALALAVANSGASDAMSMKGPMASRGGLGVAVAVAGGVFCGGVWFVAALVVLRRMRRARTRA